MRSAAALVVALVALVGCGPAPNVEDPSDVADEAAAPPPAAAAAPVYVAVPPAPAPSVLQPCEVVPVAPCYIVTHPAPPPPQVIAVPAAHPPIVRTAPAIDPFVRAVLHRQNRKIRRCYEQGLRRDPSLAGRVVMQMSIDRDGEVDSVRDAGSTLPNEQVLECIVDVLEDVDFHRSVGPSITYPFDLSPGWRG